MYGTAHLYLFFKVRSAFPLSAVSINFSEILGTELGLFLIFMALSPFLVHLSSLKASDNFSKVFAYVSYIWVAILLLFFAAAVSLDLYNL